MSICDYWNGESKGSRHLSCSIRKICYNSCCFSCADPHHRSSYLQSNKFLALLNGDTPHKDMKRKNDLTRPVCKCTLCCMHKHNTFLHFTSSVWRENFLRIKKLVLIGGPDDGVITPWQSRLVLFSTADIFICICYRSPCCHKL